jgi:Bacterial regulatory helix-turn-helix protein, lysR family
VSLLDLQIFYEIGRAVAARPNWIRSYRFGSGPSIGCAVIDAPLDLNPLNLLAVLNAVLSEGSVAKAANRLHVTASAVSNALARLRILMGDLP